MKKYLYVLISVLLILGTIACCSDSVSTEPVPEEIGQVTDENKADAQSETIDSERADVTDTTADDELKVHFLDVGQGDSIFIQLPDSQCMLIDAGERGNGTKITSYIKNLGYTKIDYILCTHPHSDHIGSMQDVIETLDADAIYMPRKNHTSSVYVDLLQTIKQKGKKIKEAKAGVTILSKGNLEISIVSPEKEYDEINNVSAVVHLRYKDSSFLFTGDIENTATKDISRDIDVDVLKVSHHGSSNATNKYLLDRTTPRIAVISCGKDNSYGHPHKETIGLFDDKKITYYRTDVSGDIVITTDGKSYSIKENKSESAKKASAESLPQTMEDSKNETTGKSSEEVPAAESKTNQVYKTKTGKKYHSSGCSYLSKSSIAVTRTEAQAQGLTPCSKCNP